MFNKIKLKDVYTGTIKRCNDVFKYKKYGEVEFIPSFKSAHMIEGVSREIVEVVEDGAVLIGKGNDKYAVLDSSSGLSNGFVLSVEPLYDSAIFVDQSTVKPVFENNEEELSIRKLVKRINGLK